MLLRTHAARRDLTSQTPLNYYRYWIWSVGDRLLLPSTELQIAASEAASISPELQETIVTNPYWSVVGLGLSIGMLAAVPLYSRMYVAKLGYRPAQNLLEITTNEPFGMKGKPTSMPMSEVSLFGGSRIGTVEETEHIQLEVRGWASRMLRGRCLVARRGTWALADGEERLLRLLGGTTAAPKASAAGDDSGGVAVPDSAASQAIELLRLKRKAELERRRRKRNKRR